MNKKSDPHQLGMTGILGVAEETFAFISQKAHGDLLEELLCEEHVETCSVLDKTLIQDSWSWRNTYTARELALELVDEKGEIKRDLLDKAIQILEDNLYSLGIGRHHDAPRMAHLLRILQLFYEQPEYAYALKRINRPHGHPGAEKLIRETLFLAEAMPLTDVHVRQASLAALLTTLRQNVGSCFATAPAIMIQQDQPLQFLADIAQLLGTGRLKRTFDGEEYAVPLSVSWGVGDLLRPVFLGPLGRDPWQALALSPGLQAAFESAGLVHPKQDNKNEVIESLLKQSGLLQKHKNPFSFIIPDTVIQEILLFHFNLKGEEVNRYRRMIHGSSMMAQVARGEKALACERYLKAYDMAKGAFKSVTDNPLLKAWEFTLASLAEAKANFARWNLYSSLGLNPEEPDGIGQALQEYIQEKIQRLNEEIEESQSRYDHLFAQVKSLEARASRASEKELEWLRAEYQVRRTELNGIISQRDEAYEKGRRISNLLPLLLNFYRDKFKDFFQEVYDAEMHDVSTNPYDDSPAGFRLLFKHGRTNTALWSLIYSPGEYLDALTSFFTTTEIELIQLEEAQGLENEISHAITAIVMKIKLPGFLEASFFRLARAYQETDIKNPLDHLGQIKRKPWSYISGGTMDTLVSCYYGRSKKPEEKTRWAESENELLVFMIDTIKELSLSFQKMFQENPERSMLAHSPTHAFLIKPGWFKEGWESDVYTYTWVRDHWADKQRQFISSIRLDPLKMDYLLSQVLLFVSPDLQALIKHAVGKFSYDMHPPDFRKYVLEALSYERWIRESGRLQFFLEELDSCLFNLLPVFPSYQLRDKLATLFDAVDEINAPLKKKLFSSFAAFDEKTGRLGLASAKELREVAKSLLMVAFDKTRHAAPFHQIIVRAMQKIGLSYPAPILIGDTNWVKNTFGFIISPGTDALEFWRFDDCGSQGRPMSLWKRYLDGSDPKEWGIYTSPKEYGY